MDDSPRGAPALLLLMLAAPASVLSAPAADSGLSDEAERWFEEDVEPVPQVGEQELEFLSGAPQEHTPLSDNRIRITRASLEAGWVALEQCYQGLDAVPDAEIVYRYRDIRNLRVVSAENIGRALPQGQTIQLNDVRHGATLCIQAEVRILYRQPDGGLELRNGPFLRKFLDGYFPLRVALDVRFPPDLLRLRAVFPDPQPGFAVQASAGQIRIDSHFAGTLNIRLGFEPASVEAPPP